jgi:hypothetical protein
MKMCFLTSVAEGRNFGSKAQKGPKNMVGLVKSGAELLPDLFLVWFFIKSSIFPAKN